MRLLNYLNNKALLLELSQINYIVVFLKRSIFTSIWYCTCKVFRTQIRNSLHVAKINCVFDFFVTYLKWISIINFVYYRFKYLYVNKLMLLIFISSKLKWKRNVKSDFIPRKVLIVPIPINLLLIDYSILVEHKFFNAKGWWNANS